MNILKFSDESSAFKFYITNTLHVKTLCLPEPQGRFKQWLLDNCACLWHTGEIWIII